MPRIVGILSVLMLFGIHAAFADSQIEQRFGSGTPRDRQVPPFSAMGQLYHQQVAPILESRCVVCHGCYDAPCQLKLSSPEGIDRGLTKKKVYDGTRLLAENLTRLFEDAQTTAEWRDKEFAPVLNEHQQSVAGNLDASVLYRALLLKQQHPLPDTAVLPDSFDFALNRDQQCPTIEEYDQFAGNYPLWGMPYGLPALTGEEHSTLITWLKAGAPMAPAPPLDRQQRQQLEQWEAFLNGDSLKRQLMSRYLYEHLFLNHLYFDNQPPGNYFKLVRSATPPGQPIRLIATRRPYDDPGVKRVYYRLQRERAAILAKTHLPYPLNPERIRRYHKLFLEPDYQVTTLPGYDPKVAANPFVAFHDLPVRSRYQFMLDDAQITIMNFIKGPVCRGQLALNVINDRFWVFFVNPELNLIPDVENFLAQQKDHLRLPGEASSNALPISSWIRYSRLQKRYLQAKAERMKRIFADGSHLTLDLVWDGGGSNPNAALTVFRHFDSASVVRGLVGTPPKTAWLIDYPILERIHYLLVAGFDIYGNAGHQLLTRLYMDFLRMESEFNFLALLPPDARQAEHNFWYRDTDVRLRNYLFGKPPQFDRPTGISYHSQHPKLELFTLLKQRLQAVLDQRYSLEQATIPYTQQQQLKRLARLRGLPVSRMPEMALLSVTDNSGQQHLYSVIGDLAHSNITSLFDEESTRLPQEDTLTLTAGVLGNYPGAFWQVSEAQLPQLVEALFTLNSEEDYRRFMDRFGMRRSDSQFWQHSDKVHQLYRQAEPVEAGWLDYNRLENR